MDRREFLRLSAGLSFSSALGFSSHLQQAVAEPMNRMTGFPTFSQIQSWLARQSNSVRKRIGASAQGRPIDLLTFQPGGAHTALFLGGVHPNEPAGLPTIQLLAETLATPGNPVSAAFPNVTFLFVPVVDPDGLVLNEDFASQPTNMERYLLSYFRPALADTAIYTFPYQFGQSSASVPPTHECRILMSIIDELKPIYINELHGAEYSTAIYRSDDTASNAAIQEDIWSNYPLPRSQSSKTFQMETAAEKIAGGRVPNAGGTIDYGSQFQSGTQVFNLELGLWTNPMLENKDISGITRGEAELFYSDAVARGFELYQKYFPGVQEVYQAAPTPNAIRFYLAFQERASMATFGPTDPSDPTTAGDRLTQDELFRTVGGPIVLLLRNYALMYRLALELGVTDAADALREYIVTTRGDSVAKYLERDENVPIGNLVQTLMTAGLTALKQTQASTSRSSGST
jgi:Zinc carboxypeptidase